MMLSHSDFLLNSQEFLTGKSRMRLNDLVSISTCWWGFHLLLLRHSQNLIMFSWWQLKKTLRLLRMRATCFWSRWDNGLNIFLTMWIELVTIMILETYWRCVAWLIPHLMAKNSASVLVMLTAWWSVLIIGLLWTCTCMIEEAMLFLTLASVTMSVLDGVFNDSMTRLLSCWIWDLKRQPKFFLNKWKEKQLEKQLIILLPSLNSGLKGLKEGKTFLNQFSILTKWPLIRPCCHLVNELSKSGWGGVGELLLFYISNWRMWLSGRACTLSWNLPLSFYKYKWIGIRPAIASMLADRAVLNASLIHKVACLWSFPKIFNGYIRRALV